MSSRFFISRRLKKEIENDLKKRSMIEEKINKDMEAFKDEIDDETVISIFEFIEKYGNKKQKESLSEIKQDITILHYL